jgi:Ca2+-dependent lipid-binding protein
VENNVFNPVWNEEVVMTVQFPELAVLRFAVMDHLAIGGGDFVAQYSLPVAHLQSG